MLWGSLCQVQGWAGAVELGRGQPGPYLTIAWRLGPACWPHVPEPLPRCTALLSGLSPCHLSIHQKPHTQLGRPLLPGWPRDHHCFSRGRPRTVMHGPRMWCPQASALGGRLADVLRTSHSRHGARSSENVPQ